MRARAEWLLAAGVAVASLVFVAPVLRIWRGDVSIPFTYQGEAQYYLMLAKAMEDHGGYLHNPSLGAPFGLDLHDYAVGTDQLNLALLWLLGLAIDPAGAVNVFFVLTFPLSALAAYLVLRLLRLAAFPSAVCAVLFAFLPYHLARGEGHLFLSAYFAVPLGVYLVLATLSGETLFQRRKRTIMTVAFCVVIGSTGIYYAAFTLLLLAAAAGIVLLARVGRGAVIGALACIAVIVATLAVNLAPTFAYRSEHGANLSTRRPTAESELYALKLADLVLPGEETGLPLSHVTERYRSTTPIRSEGGQSLGLVAAAGFVGLLAVALLTLVARRRLARPVVEHAAVAAILAFLIGTVGGLSVLVAQLFTSQIRGWNRISIVIGFLALIAVAAALERAGRARPPLYAAALAITLAVGFYAQVAGYPVPPYELAGAYRQDREFVRELERRLSRDADVFVLPYIAFPETGQVVDLNENDLLRGYLHSEGLRWSFGAMKGRPEDWSRELTGMPAPTVIDAAAAAGFEGLYVDRFGYQDRAAGLEAEVASLLRQQPYVSASARHSFFDLRPRRRQLERLHGQGALAGFREAVLRPLQMVPLGFTPPLRAGRFTFLWADAAQSELRIVNPSEVVRTVVVEATVDRVAGEQAPVEVTLPGAAAVTVQTPAPIRRRLKLPPGESVIRFSTPSPPVEASNANELRRHYFRLANMAVIDNAFEPFLR